MKLLIMIFTLWSFSTLFAQEVHLQPLVEEALKNNPSLKERQSKVEAVRARVPAVGTLPDPMLSFSLMNLPTNTFVFDQEPMSGKQLAFSQPVPFPGKLGLKSDIMAVNANVAEQDLQNTELNIILNVKQIYFNIFFLDRAIDVTKKNQNVLQNFIQIAETKYTVGKGIQQDVLKAQVEYAKFYEKLIALQEKRDGVVAKLNALLNRPAETPLGPTADIDFKPLDLNPDSLKQWTLNQNPMLLASQLNVERSSLKIKLARKNYLPDFNFMIAYTQRDVLANGSGGIDYLSASVGLKIPLYFWKKQRNEVQSTTFERMQYQERLNDVRNRLLASLQDALQSAQKQADLVELYKNTIIPQASQALSSAISGYQTDKVDFLTLLNNLMVLFNYEKDYYKLVSRYYQDVAKIEYLTGKQLIK